MNEAKALRISSVALTRFLRHCAYEASQRFFARGMIPEDLKWRVQNNSNDTGSLVDCLTDKVKNAPGQYAVIIEVLEEINGSSDIVKLLKDNYCECTGNQISKLPGKEVDYVCEETGITSMVQEETFSSPNAGTRETKLVDELTKNSARTGGKFRKRAPAKNLNCADERNLSSCPSTPVSTARACRFETVLIVIVVCIAVILAFAYFRPRDNFRKGCLKVDRNDLHAIEIKHLQYLTYIDAQKNEKSLSIVESVSYKWRDVASLLGYNSKAIADDSIKDSQDNCFRALMTKWLENEGTEEYPSSWNGLIKILERIGKKQVVYRVNQALC